MKWRVEFTLAGGEVIVREVFAATAGAAVHVALGALVLQEGRGAELDGWTVLARQPV